ncbi:sugar phosphate nucleotidyltransferase [Paenibacillus thermotolerans]|uniref:sugar phosphate nucleotidyltransferase n=1 Tax=Paenibacillus thermotolerans TaxID=3027807 RepID=UPI00236825C9|nr:MULTISPECIES: sugar phosphate nucleotidyltransferase [unclassified Paenibacillus]
MKGLILCAGKGTRLKPYTDTRPKTLLPVAGRPVLDYGIESLRNIGIRTIGIVINPEQGSIREYVGSGGRYGAKVDYLFQSEPKGVAHAVKQAEDFLAGESFVLLLGDNLITEDLSILIESRRSLKGNASVLLRAVPNPSEFGIAEVEGGRIVRIEEKPKQPKSNLAVIGAYWFDSHIFEAIASIKPSARGEYEITDAIQWLLDHDYPVSYSVTDKKYSDVGTPERWLEANEWMLRETLRERIVIGSNAKIDNCTFIGPVVVGNDVTLKNTVIGPHVTMQDGSRAEGVRLEGSIVLDGAEIVGTGEQPIRNRVIDRN